MDGYIDLAPLDKLSSPRHNLVFYPAESNYRLDSTVISTDVFSSSKILISRDYFLNKVRYPSSLSDDYLPAQNNSDFIEMNADLKNKKFLRMYFKEGEEIIGFGRAIKF